MIRDDMNAFSALWFSQPENNSGLVGGTHVERLIPDQHLTVHNSEERPDTYYRRGMGFSNIDVTLSRGDGIHLLVQNWDRLVRFYVRCGENLSNSWIDFKRFNVKKVDWGWFRLVLAQNILDNSDIL